jgi:Spy/CpxP family protein refolding chaperone
MMNRPWKVILVLAGIFAAGAVTGGFATVRYYKGKLLSRPVPEEWAPKTLKRLADRLDLTPAQQEEIRPIVRRSMDHLGRLRATSMAETQAGVETMQREISERLTPEQRVKYERLNRELRELRESREKIEREKRAKPDRPGEKPPAKPPGH